MPMKQPMKVGPMLHYYADPIGTGEFSKNRFRPVCDAFAQPVFIPPSEQASPLDLDPTDLCETCAKVRQAMLDMGVVRGPVASLPRPVRPGGWGVPTALRFHAT